MTFGSVLMVCTGNICRSPMAEALLRHWLVARGVSTRVSSAGVAALEGHPATPLARELLRERGLDLSAHRARQLTSELVSESEVVLVMEEAHKREIELVHPTSRGRVQLLGRFGRFEVPDPYGGGRADYARALSLIERGLRDHEEAFWGRTA